MVQVPGQHSIMYAANADGILACSTEHKDGCQMLKQDVKISVKTIKKLGYFITDDGLNYIYAGGDLKDFRYLDNHQAFWFIA
jgi:hypothetical protein